MKQTKGAGFCLALSGQWRCFAVNSGSTVLLRQAYDAQTTLVVGVPLRKIAAALQADGFCLGRWVAQRGLTGDNLVPPDERMLKFDGLQTCITRNLSTY